MHEFAVFNHRIILAENISVNAVSSASFYGRGIFTTIAIFNGEPFLWEKHWRRIINNASKIGIDSIDFAEAKVKESLYEIVAENKISRGRARLTFFDESSIAIWQAERKRKTSFLINTGDFREISNDFSLTVSPFVVNSSSPLTNIKSCNYLENILALEDAQRKGYHEAIRQNERGEIVSACMANLFWLKNGKIFTPHLETGCLAGTIREFILENFPATEKKASLKELNEADEIFLTSTGIGIAQIAEFQKKKLSRQPHELTKIFPPASPGKFK